MTQQETGIELRAATTGDFRAITKWFAAEGWDYGISDLDLSLRMDAQSIFVASFNGALLGGVRALTISEGYGIISDLVLNPVARDKGLGRALWKSAMNHLAGKHVGLDTPADWVPTYEKLGFRAVCNIRRYALLSVCNPALCDGTVVIDSDLMKAVGDFDRASSGVDRTGYISALLRAPRAEGRAIVENGVVKGYGFIRPALRGWKVGPLVATSPIIAGKLINALSADLPNGTRIHVDVPDNNAEAVAMLSAGGRNPETEVVRMYNGPALETVPGNIFSTESFDLGMERFCPICGQHVHRFGSYGVVRRDDVRCPYCGSLERHRLFWIFLEKHPDLFFKHLPQRMLHVAPEQLMKDKFRKLLGSRYVTSDICPGRADIQMDICDIKLPDDYYDAIVCFHVLEHVPDDLKAMSELRRVLTPNGVAFLMVPITTDKTFEDPSITTPQDRLRVFGQEDHVRRYGPDFIDRLRSVGFKVDRYMPADILSKSELVKMRATDDFGVAVFVCRK